MSTQGLRAIENAIQELNEQAKTGRDRIIRKHVERMDPAIVENLVYTHGRRIYPNKTLDQFFRLIHRHPVHLPVLLTGGDDNEFLARVANEAFVMVRMQALKHMDSGDHLKSIRMFVREVGTRVHGELHRLTGDHIPDRGVVSIVPTIAYGSALEAQVAGGILYFVAMKLRKKYRQQLAIKFDYIAGPRLDERGGTFPRIQIGFYGNLKPGLKRPGRSKRRRRR